MVASAWPIYLVSAAALAQLAVAELVLPALLEHRGIGIGWIGPLLMGFAGQVSLGQGGFFLIGAYTSGLLTMGLDADTRLVDPEAGIDPLLAVAIAPFVSAAIAVLIGIPLMRLRGHYLAFATLAFALIAWSLLYAQDRFTGGQYGVTVVKPLEVFGHSISGATHAAVVWAIVAIALLLSANLVHSRAGRALQAIAESEPAAAAAGVVRRLAEPFDLVERVHPGKDGVALLPELVDVEVLDCLLAAHDSPGSRPGEPHVSAPCSASPYSGEVAVPVPGSRPLSV